MNQNFNFLRLCCLLQDRDSQDLKRTVLSIAFEILYENNNAEMLSEDLYKLTNEKFDTDIEKDFFDILLQKSESFEIINADKDFLVKLTKDKYNEVDKSISEFAIEPHIENFLRIKGADIQKKEMLVNLLYQSIYENIYTFKAEKINTIIPQNIATTVVQSDLDLFNDFLEYDEPAKNRCLYNQFAKALEFAILTSGKGITQFSENIYKDKCYLLDTNIIFRLIGVGGDERQRTILQLIKDCQKQGINFEYSSQTLIELNKKLEQCVLDIKRAETSHKLEIIEDIFKRNPHFFNDDFITQYSRLRLNKTVNSPEQYELEMKARFKSLCKELNIQQANHNIKIDDLEKNILANSFITKRKEINENYKYSKNSAKVDAYNVIYVQKRRGGNNYNYSDVKSFYLTTDRGLNRILSLDKTIIIPATILPSQLFVIHNPTSNSKSSEPDYKTFFRFLKRRTSEFKLRGKDVINYITQARLYTTNSSHIEGLIEAYSDQRYKHSINDSLEEGKIISFTDFTHTYFDKRNEELQDIQKNYSAITDKSENELKNLVTSTKSLVRYLDTFICLILIPVIALVLKFYTSLSWGYVFLIIIFLEAIKFFISSRFNVFKNIWINLFEKRAKTLPYYKLTSDIKYIEKGKAIIVGSNDNIWK